MHEPSESELKRNETDEPRQQGFAVAWKEDVKVSPECQRLPEPSEEVMHEPSESEPKRNEADEPRHYPLLGAPDGDWQVAWLHEPPADDANHDRRAPLFWLNGQFSYPLFVVSFKLLPQITQLFLCIFGIDVNV
eukprot:Em0019g997a